MPPAVAVDAKRPPPRRRRLSDQRSAIVRFPLPDDARLGTRGRHTRINGLSLADAQAAGGLRALPGMLEGTALGVITRNQRVAGFNCPVVVRVEKP